MIQNIFSALISKSWEESLIKYARQQGIHEGKQGLPTDTTPPYSVGENNVRVKIETQLVAIQKTLESKVKSTIPLISQKKGELQSTDLTFSARRTIDTLRLTLQGELESRRPALEDASYRKHKSEGEYNAFRQTNEISSAPEFPTAEERKRILALTGLFVLLETIFNALFWKQGLEGNLGKGVIYAFVLSLLNVGFGFVGGYFLAYKNLEGKNNKNLGWGVFAVSIVIVLIVISQIVSYRMEAAGSDGVNVLLNFVVALYGVGFALGAAYEGYCYHGKYPGYERASAGYLKAVDDLRKEKESIAASIFRQCANDEEARLGAGRRLHDVLVFLTNTKAELDTLQVEYRAAVAHLSGIKETAVGVYRDTNRATKGAALPSPPWFNDPVERYDQDSEVLMTAIIDLSQAKSEADSAISRIRDLSEIELPQITAVRGEYQALHLTTLVNEADREGLAKYRREIAYGVGNQGQHRGNSA